MRSLFNVGFGVGFHNNFMRPALGQGEEQEWQSLQTGTTPTTTPVKPTTTPTSGGGTDWGKLISSGITAAGGAITAYEKEKAATVAQQTEALKRKTMPVTPGAYPPPQTGTSPVLIAGLVGVGIIALGAVIMVATRGKG